MNNKLDIKYFECIDDSGCEYVKRGLIYEVDGPSEKIYSQLRVKISGGEYMYYDRTRFKDVTNQFRRECILEEIGIRDINI